MEIILAKLKLNSTSSIRMCIICQKSMKNGEEGIKSETHILTWQLTRFLQKNTWKESKVWIRKCPLMDKNYLKCQFWIEYSSWMERLTLKSRSTIWQQEVWNSVWLIRWLKTWLECFRCHFLLFHNLWSTKRNLWYRCALKSHPWWPHAVQLENSWLHSHSFHLQLPALWSVRFTYLPVSLSKFIKFWLKSKKWLILWIVCALIW